MGTGYQNLQVWRDAMALAIDTYKTTDRLRDLSLRDQIRRAAVSVPSNIAEGDERDTDKDSVRFFYIAKGSLAELRTQIEIANAVGLLPNDGASNIETQAAAVGRRLGALIKARSATHDR
jgi:four helix bundle protein